MPSFKFGQIVVESKDFHKQNQLTDIFMINVNKVVISDRAPHNHGKDYISLCTILQLNQVDGEEFLPLFMKTSKNILNYGVSQYDKISFNVSEVPD